MYVCVCHTRLVVGVARRPGSTGGSGVGSSREGRVQRVRDEESILTLRTCGTADATRAPLSKDNPLPRHDRVHGYTWFTSFHPIFGSHLHLFAYLLSSPFPGRRRTRRAFRLHPQRALRAHGAPHRPSERFVVDGIATQEMTANNNTSTTRYMHPAKSRSCTESHRGGGRNRRRSGQTAFF